MGEAMDREATACLVLTECSVVQTQERTLLLEGTNSYRRAIQYQQLDKLQHPSTGAHGFYVQVPSFTSAVCTQKHIGQTYAFNILRSSHGSSAHAYSPFNPAHIPVSMHSSIHTLVHLV